MPARKGRRPSHAVVRQEPVIHDDDRFSQGRGDRGRPAFFEDGWKLQRFLFALSKSASIEDASVFANTDPSTALRCIRRGRRAHIRFERHGQIEERDNAYREFYLLVRQAAVGSKVRLQAAWFDAATHRDAKGKPTDWQAAERLLARRYPEEYAPIAPAPIGAFDDTVNPEFHVVRREQVPPAGSTTGHHGSPDGSKQPGRAEPPPHDGLTRDGQRRHTTEENDDE